MDSFDQATFAAIDLLSILVFLFVFLDHPCKFNCEYIWEMTHGVSNQTGSELYPSSHDNLPYYRFQIIFFGGGGMYDVIELHSFVSSKLCFCLFFIHSTIK